jgi:hypothetical protein
VHLFEAEADLPTEDCRLLPTGDCRLLLEKEAGRPGGGSASCWSHKALARRPEPSCEQLSWWEPRSPPTPRVEGSGRTVLACPITSRKPSTNQPGSRAGLGRRAWSMPTSLASPLAPGGLLACHGVHRPLGPRAGADRPARQQEGARAMTEASPASPTPSAGSPARKQPSCRAPGRSQPGAPTLQRLG